MNETTTPEKTPKAPSNSFVYAVTRDSLGVVQFPKAKTRTELAKTLAQYYTTHEILGVFKGRQLNITEKKSFNFS